MPLYVGDYLRDTQHLTTTQHGAYLLLIMHYWQHGGLPSEEEAIARISRLSLHQWKSNSQAIAELFLPGWKHKRIEHELEKMKTISAKRAMAGQRGGLMNRGKNNVARAVQKAIVKQRDTHSHSHIESSSDSESVESQKGRRGNKIEVSQSLRNWAAKEKKK